MENFVNLFFGVLCFVYAVAFVLNRPAETFYKGAPASREARILGGLDVAMRTGAVVAMSLPVNYRVESVDRNAVKRE